MFPTRGAKSDLMGEVKEQVGAKKPVAAWSGSDVVAACPLLAESSVGISGFHPGLLSDPQFPHL